MGEGDRVEVGSTRGLREELLVLQRALSSLAQLCTLLKLVQFLKGTDILYFFLDHHKQQASPQVCLLFTT